MALIGPATVLPLYLSTLTDRNWLIGIGSSIFISGWFLPQLFGAGIIARLKYRLPWYNLMGVFRVISIACIAVLTLILGGRHGDLLLISFLVLFTCHSISGGLAGVVFLDIIGKSVPTIGKPGTPGRGKFFGWRVFLGGLVSILAGFLIINPVLEHISYPTNFALLFGIAAIMIAIGVITFGTLKEEPSFIGNAMKNSRSDTLVACARSMKYESSSDKSVASTIFKGKDDIYNQKGFYKHLFSSFSLLKTDQTFRRYFMIRHIMTLWNFGLPFYILFAQSRYDLSPFWIGAFLAARYAGEMGFNVLWALLSDRGHNRAIIRIASLLTVFPPLIVFSQVIWQTPEIVFAIAFFVSGGVISSFIVGGNNYLLQHAPPNKRPLYIGVMNSTLGISVLSAGLGGLIIDHLGYMTLFGLVSVFSLFSIAAALRLLSPGKG
ncbi:MAG: MFS transporter [Candidatus Hatepunaea meridiana]|nr:MFS transporter [Candidatus Hatepunaea meridiana]